MMMLGSLDRFSQAFGESAMENLKQAMLQHELIFRSQVRELHRLYWTQKTLMNELRAKGFGACIPSSSPWLAATEFRESAEGKTACLESYCAIEMRSSLARNVGALEKVKGNTADSLVKNLRRNCTVQLPANYFLEREFFKEDAIHNVNDRGILGSGTGELIVDKGIRQRAGSFRSKVVIDMENSIELECHEEGNEELCGGLGLPVKKCRDELWSHLSVTSGQVSSGIMGNNIRPMSSVINLSGQQGGRLLEQKPPLSFVEAGLSGIVTDFDQSSNKQQFIPVLIDLNLPLMI